MSPANKVKILLATCITALLLSGTASSSAANSNAMFVEQSLIAQGAQLTHHRLTGQATFIGTKTGKAIALPNTGTPRTASAVAMDALTAYGALFGLRNPSTELTQKSLKIIDGGRSSVRYQQNYNGIPVIGGEMIVNLSNNNGLLSINGEISPKLAVPIQPTVSTNQAVNTALSAVAKWHNTTTATLTASVPVLSIYDPRLIGPDNYPASLVWRIEVTSTTQQPIRELVLIAAHNGAIALHFNQVDTAMVRETYTSAETATIPGTLVCNESDPTCAAGDTDAQNAHQFAKDTYDFYSTNHTRDSIDNAGMTIISSVHFDDGYCPNAYWNGSQMLYCTGLVVDDVVAHELTHGVTENSSSLFYYYQSGAINESFSDLWGEFVDLGNGLGDDTTASRWLMGEDATIVGGAIRSMKNPPAFSDPDKIRSANYYTGSGDNGGVHFNSGVNNKAVYLMVDGDTFNGRTITGIGIPKVAKIYYEVQTNLLTSGADYLDLYNALYQGCQNLIGTAGITASDCTQVRAATDAVEMNMEPVTDFNSDPGVCPYNTPASTIIFNDDFETGIGAAWTRSNAIGTGTWTTASTNPDGPYIAYGTEAMLGQDATSVSDHRAEVTVTLPAGKTSYLHFNHAVALEYLWDGGVLEYSTDGGTTWNDTTTLARAGLGYNGVIYTSLNPLSGRSAFTNPSHGYVGTRYDLTTLAGQTVAFRWRVGTDSSNAQGYGWFIDNVSVVTDCLAPATLAFAQTSYTVSEGGNATITVSRQNISTGAVTVTYTASAGTASAGLDFTATTGTISWADGDMTDKTFTVTIVDDAVYESAAETINLALSSPSGATLGSPSSATLNITDNDSAPSSGGGGGGIGWQFLLISMLLLPLRRRLRLTI